eukprot:TRINITY_DN13828_c0_g1_i9.p1 TRINITY_DN13828_c0_g1~~TRINITY_DN13828_c0_g1_i9.p1  ORF type:complete len:350 (+),score=37.82 TRINITY_DN13828_c0_g1_i9:939-1988(+)
MGLVMDLYNAGSLLDAGQLPAAERPMLLMHCAAALRALKRLFWSHCDVHPGNVLIHRDQQGPRFALADMGRCSPSSTASTHFDAWCLGICGAFASGLATPRGAAQLAPGVVPWERMYEQCPAVRDAAVAVLVDDEVSRVVIALLDGPLKLHTAGVGHYEDPLHPVDWLSDASRGAPTGAAGVPLPSVSSGSKASASQMSTQLEPPAAPPSAVYPSTSPALALPEVSPCVSFHAAVWGSSGPSQGAPRRSMPPRPAAQPSTSSSGAVTQFEPDAVGPSSPKVSSGDSQPSFSASLVRPADSATYGGKTPPGGPLLGDASPPPGAAAPSDPGVSQESDNSGGCAFDTLRPE